MITFCRSCIETSNIRSGDQYLPKKDSIKIDIMEIVNMRKQGLHIKEIVKITKLSKRHVFQILHDYKNGKTEKKIDPIRLCERCKEMNSHYLGKDVYIPVKKNLLKNAYA